MAFQSVPETAEIAVVYLQNGQRNTLTFFARLDGGYTQTNIDELAEAVDSWAAAEFIPQLSSSNTYVQSDVRGLESIVDLAATNNTSAGAGTVNSAPLANSLALSVKRASNFTGRSARGRVFYPLVAAMQATNEDFVLQASADAIVSALNQLRGTILVPAGWTEVIVSRQSAGALRPTGVTFDVAGYTVVDLEIDSQRRRMPGR